MHKRIHQLADTLTTVVIVNYNGIEHIDECLSALLSNSVLPLDIIVVDNNSTDSSPEHIQSAYPTVTLISNVTNIGYAQAINQGLEAAKGDFLVVLNMDVVVQSGWLPPLIEYLVNVPEAGAVAPCIILYDKPDQINALGQNLHVTGLGFNRRLNYLLLDNDSEPTNVSGLHGAAFATRVDTFKSIGGMNEKYFLYHEDVEVSLRYAIAGYRITTIPTSRVLHKYDLHMTPDKLHWLERHRWMTMFSVYRKSTILALSPIFLFTELLMLFYCLIRGNGYLKAKVGAIKWVISNPIIVRASREKVQNVREVSDFQVLSRLRWIYDIDQFLVLARQRGGWLLETVFKVFRGKPKHIITHTYEQGEL